jgi:S-methylmethionine-dependent homocysteine/selenocysteine methylase
MEVDIMSITLLDGGMGQELLARSSAKATGLWSTKILMDSPELVRAVHSDYFVAGADIATTNSYAIHRDRLRPFGAENRFNDLHQLACKIAVSARDKYGYGLVAGSMGPTGWSYRPDLAPPAEEAAELYAEIAKLHEPYVDLILCETMSSVAQARGAVMGARVVTRPVWLAVTVDDEDGSKLRSGESVTEILPMISEFKIEALLVNCSVPEAVSKAIPLLANQGVPVGGYANGFVKIAKDFMKKSATVDILEKRPNLGPEIYADFVDGWIKHGATVAGGCCEIGPAHIEELARRLKRGSKGKPDN